MSSIEVAGTGSSTRADGQGLFQCGSCKRHYNRLDHLARHVRSHTNFKPHRCSICGKSFSRTDLLKRHVAAHDVRSAKVNNLSRGDADEVPGRVTQACRACAANHVRCTESKPCRRCAEKGLECVYRSDDPLASGSPPAFQGNSLMMSPSSSMPTTLDVQVEGPMALDMADTRQGPLRPSSPLQGTPMPPQMHLGTAGPDALGGAIPAPPAFGTLNHHLPQDPRYRLLTTADDDFMDAQPALPTGYCTPAIAEWDFLPGLWSSANDDPMGLSHPFPVLELDDLDLRFLDTYNTTVPFEYGDAPRPNAPPQNLPAGNTDPGTSASKASEAFRAHHWRFRPNPKDRGGAEEHNLSLPSDARDNPSPDSHISYPRRVTPARLTTASRDNILTTVIKSCRPENLPKAVAAFPSVELLDTLIQFYLTSPIARADSFIHAATFDPNEKKPELLLAMAAAGAVLTSDPTLAKLGYAMQETVRTAIPKVWEGDNTLVRNLELTQAFLINLEIGLWSGVSRKVEITESFLQSPLTMFRRGGRFRRASYPPVILDAEDQATSADAAWRAWVQQESFKRTAFRMVQHDLNSSFYLMVNPLISYAELSLPLPCAPALWCATTPQQWKSLLASPGSPLIHQPPTIAEYLDDLNAFQPPQHHGSMLDLTFANEAFLACAWSLAWECIQLTTFQRPTASSTHTSSNTTTTNTPRRWNPYLLTNRREELLKLLAHFRLTLHHHHHRLYPSPSHPLHPNHHSSSSPSTFSSSHPQQDPTHTHHLYTLHIRLELIQLHLHTPFEEVQIFAGIEGPEHARAAYAAVADWAAVHLHTGPDGSTGGNGANTGGGGEAARKAIAHAGQVLRFARQVGRGMVLGPAAVGMYQAALVLWVWGLLAAQRREAVSGRRVVGVGSNGGKGRGGLRGGIQGGTGGGENGMGLGGGVGDMGGGADVGKVWLDGEDELALQRWTCYGVGRPCLRGSGAGGEVSLGDPEGVLGAIIGVLRENFEGLPKPHLVDRLLQLMEALQKSSVGMMEFHGQSDKP